MRKLPLTLAIAAALPLTTLSLTTMAKPFVAKNVGQGFTGVTGDFTHAQYNPALLANFAKNDDLFFTFGGGALGSDQDDLIDSIDETQDLIDEIEANPKLTDAQRLETQMKSLDGKALAVDLGLNLMIAIPMERFSLGIFANQEARVTSGFNYDARDTANAILLAAADGDLGDLKSGASVLGFSVLDAGLAIAKSWKNDAYDIHYGTNLKYQRIDLFNYAETISTFDEDNFDADDYLADDSQFNIDLGVQVAWGDKRQWQAGLAAKNLLGFDLDSVANPVDGQIYQFELDPTVTTGVAYHNDWLRFAIDVDLMAHSEFNAIGEVQYAAAGLEFDAWEWAQLRLGYRSDIKSNAEDVASFGIGLSPFDVLSLDLSVVGGNNDTLGGAVQLGIKF